MQTLCILGRQPALGNAELESLYGSQVVKPVGNVAAIIELEPATIDFSRLGGTVKFCQVLTTLETTNWDEIQAYLAKTIPDHLPYLPEGKLKLGLSVYGIEVNPRRINATGLSLKKVIKAEGRSVRVVPNTEKDLNSAQVLHNQLTSALGWEFVFVRSGNQTILAQNIAEQDIEAYARRDQARPMRDSHVGMLPPKLAQIIINLANGPLDQPATDQNGDCGSLSSVNFTKTVLDPFCGTGVVLQEAMMMGYQVYGSDLETRMIDYSQKNIEWLTNTLHPLGVAFHLEQGDATSATWSKQFDLIAAETYLGRPLTRLPHQATFQKIVTDTNYIHKKFLANLARQTKAGFRLCIAVPAWRTPSGFKHLPVLDQLTDLGYTRVSFAHVGKDQLIYHRDDQVVARELVILSRN